MANSKIKSGFTLIEIVIAFAILAVLLILGFGSWRQQINKARDADRKTDLQRLKIAFEDYYGDKQCYPPTSWFDNPNDCGSGQLKPYLDKIPCDPITKQPYYLERSNCQNYRLLTNLDDDSDPMSKKLNCNPDCGFGANLNYGITSGNLAVSSSSGGTTYYCQNFGNCTAKPANLDCSPSYSDPNCGNTNLCAATQSTCTPI